MQLRFTKMHGAGNDFVVIDSITQRVSLRARDIRRISDRRLGIGCDQVLVVEPPGRPDVDFRYRIYNADGSEVEQCGNGARCFARFVREKKLTNKRVITVETRGGTLELRARDKHQVEVNMGAPRFEPIAVPIQVNAQLDQYALSLDGETVNVGAVSMGNPHAILRVEDIDEAEVARLGPLIEGHRLFPAQANAGFMQVVSPTEIHLRVFERGVGETLACGSGACAAVAHGISLGWLQETVTVNLPGGKLCVSWKGQGEPVMMTGPTANVFEGSIRL